MAIQFNCSGCGNLFRVGDEMAGRKGRCPKCAVINQIPLLDGSMPAAAPPPQFAGQTTATPPPPQPSVPGPTHDANFADPDAADVSAKPKKKNKLLIPLLAGGALVLLLSCGGLGYLAYGWFFGASISNEQKYMPNNTQFIYSTRLDQAQSSDFFKQMKALAPNDGEGTLLNDKTADKMFGFTMADVDRLTMAGSMTSEQFIVMLRMKKAVKGADIKSKVGGSYKETKINDVIIYEAEKESEPSFCVPESDLIVGGRFKDLKAVIERGKKPEFSEVMQTALKKADFSKTITIALAVDGKEIVDKLKSMNKEMKEQNVAHDPKNPRDPKKPADNPLAQMMAGLDKNAPSDAQLEKYSTRIQSIVWSFDMKKDLSVTLHITCKDNVTAEDSRKLMDAFLVIIRLGGEAAPDFPKETLEDLTNMKVSSSGTTATATGTIKGPPIVAFAKKLSEKK